MTRVLLALLLVGCAPLETRETRASPRTPADLVARARSLALDEEWSALYDLLSERRRDEVGRIEFVLGFKSQRVGPPTDYRVVDVVSKGQCEAIFFDPSDAGRAIVYFDYRESGKPWFEVKVLVLREGGEWHVDGPVE
jgi:hypothetical protein